MSETIKRGDLYYAKLEGEGSQQTGVRPVLIYSNDLNNKFSPTVNVFPLTSEMKKLVVHVYVKGCGLERPSMILTEQMTTINKYQLRSKIGKLSSFYMDQVDIAFDIQTGRRPVSYAKKEVNPFEVA